MGFLDFILFPFYVGLFYLIFKSTRKKFNDPILNHYHNVGFWAKVIAVFAFAIFNTYISKGDSLVLYQREGYNIYQLILKDSNNIKWLLMEGKNFDETLLSDSWNKGYLPNEANFMVVRFVTVISFITMGKYLLTNLVFGLIAFSGTWKLYEFFYEQYPSMYKKFALAILFLPTFLFWSSGVLKDSLCIASIGWITYCLYKIVVKKRGLIINTVLILFFGYLIWVIKPYILISYVPFFIFFLVLKNINLVNSKAVKLIITPAIIIGCMFAFSKVLVNLKEELGAYSADGLTDNIKNLNTAYENQASDGTSKFSYGVEFDGSVTGLIKMAPLFIGTTFFRPFIWESKKVSTLLSSLEGLALMIFTISVFYKAGFKTIFQTLSKNPLATYSFLFAVIFALFVGATTLNFGSLCRYKIPCMPFYLISIFLIQEATRLKKENLLKNKQAVL